MSVLVTHLAEPIRCHAGEFHSRQDTKNILDRVADENPKVIEDLVPELLSLTVVQEVFQNLPRERDPVRFVGTADSAAGNCGDGGERPPEVER